MKKWRCPTCGDVALAPSRPTMRDSRRWCLLCSAKGAAMVERVCVARFNEELREREALEKRRVEFREQHAWEKMLADNAPTNYRKLRVEGLELRPLWRVMQRAGTGLRGVRLVLLAVSGTGEATIESTCLNIKALHSALDEVVRRMVWYGSTYGQRSTLAADREEERCVAIRKLTCALVPEYADNEFSGELTPTWNPAAAALTAKVAEWRKP